MITDKNEILLKLFQNRSAITHFGVTRLGLFGSFVRNEQNQKSDIDLLVDFEEKEETYKNFFNLSFSICIPKQMFITLSLIQMRCGKLYIRTMDAISLRFTNIYFQRIL